MFKTISIISGKGGVGKTFLSISLAHALSKSNKVLVLDFDLFHPNVHIYLSNDENKLVNDFYFMNNVLNKQISYKQAIYKHKNGFFVMPSSTFLKDVYDMELDEKHFANIVKDLKNYFDYIIFDTPAGINELSKLALDQTDSSIVVTTNNDADKIDNLKMIEFARLQSNHCLGFVANKFNEFGLYDTRKFVSFFNLPELGKVPYFNSNDFEFLFSNKIFNKCHSLIADSFVKLLR